MYVCIFIKLHMTAQSGPALSSESFYATRIDPPKGGSMILMFVCDVFLVETFFFLSKLITLHGPTAAKKTIAPKKAIVCSLSGENNSTKNKIK